MDISTSYVDLAYLVHGLKTFFDIAYIEYDIWFV